MATHIQIECIGLLNQPGNVYAVVRKDERGNEQVSIPASWEVAHAMARQVAKRTKATKHNRYVHIRYIGPTVDENRLLREEQHPSLVGEELF
jgi:hypothetical protein